MDAERARILAELGAASDSFAAEGADAPPSADAPPAERPPPAEARPEDAIPDRPENAAVRDFLAHAPSKGLWMPMGVEVKVMKCWRCKAYGHRTGDRECPLNATGNVVLDAERVAREDPMAALALKRQRDDAAAAPSALEALVGEMRDERRARKRRKKEKKRKKKKKKKEKKKKKTRPVFFYYKAKIKKKKKKNKTPHPFRFH